MHSCNVQENALHEVNYHAQGFHCFQAALSNLQTASGHSVQDDPQSVAVIAALGPDNAAAQAEAGRLTAAWEAAAPHHLAWLDPAKKNELQEHASQLQGVPGTDTMAPAQVSRFFNP